MVYENKDCMFTEEIGTYMRCWESPGDLPLVIEMLCLFASGAQRNERKDITFLSLVKDHPVFLKNVHVCKNLNILVKFRSQTIGYR